MFCVFKEFVDHGGQRGNVAQALTQWSRPVASSEVHDVHHLGDAPHIAPPHPHGDRNCQHLACMYCRHQFDCWPQP